MDLWEKIRLVYQLGETGVILIAVVAALAVAGMALNSIRPILMVLRWLVVWREQPTPWGPPPDGFSTGISHGIRILVMVAALVATLWVWWN